MSQTISERLNALVQAAEGLLDAPEPGAGGLEPETLARVWEVRRAAARLREAHLARAKGAEE